MFELEHRSSACGLPPFGAERRLGAASTEFGGGGKRGAARGREHWTVRGN